MPNPTVQRWISDQPLDPDPLHKSLSGLGRKLETDDWLSAAAMLTGALRLLGNQPVAS